MKSTRIEDKVDESALLRMRNKLMQGVTKSAKKLEELESCHSEEMKPVKLLLRVREAVLSEVVEAINEALK